MRAIRASVYLIDPAERAPKSDPVPPGVRREMCGYGHDMSHAYQRKRDGAWECRTCRQKRSRERNRRIRAAAKLTPAPPALLPLGSKLRWESLDDAPLGVTPLEVCHVG